MINCTIWLAQQIRQSKALNRIDLHRVFRISVNDLINSGQGHNFVMCVIDHNEFHKYEFRESQSADEDQDSVFPTDEKVHEPNTKEISV